MKRPPVFSQSGGSCLSTIVLTISLKIVFRWEAILDHQLERKLKVIDIARAHN